MVIFRSPVVRQLGTINVIDRGRVNKIRGIA